MADGYVHGIVVKEGTGEVQVIRSPSQSIVGIVGTAPQSKVLVDNTPISFLGKKPALDAVYPAGSKDEKGTIYDAIVGVYEQTPARMILVKSKSDKQADIFDAIDSLLEAESITGFKPKILIVPGFGNSNPVVTPASPTAPTTTPESTIEPRLMTLSTKNESKSKEVRNG